MGERFGGVSGAVAIASAAVVGCAVVLVLVPATVSGSHQALCRDAAGGAVALSCDPVVARQEWRDLVVDEPVVAAPVTVRIEGDAGEVGNPDGLLRPGGGVTTLRASGDSTTRLIVDMGRLTSGYVELGVRAVSGAPLRMAYAEGRQYLGRFGDADTDPASMLFYLGRTFGRTDDPDSRADVFAPHTGPTLLRSPGVRGSQRYIAISLDGAGTAELDYVQVRATNYRSTVDRYEGHFLSSDPVLNQAWYASAHALHLSTVGDRTRPGAPPWVILDGPKRDLIGYAGDLWVSGTAAYYQDDQWRQIVRDSINIFACQQFPDGIFPLGTQAHVSCPLGEPGPPDGPPADADLGLLEGGRLESFTAWWVIDLADYLRYTGDTDFVAPLLPVARRAVGFFDSNQRDGLYETRARTEFDINWHPTDTAVGVDSYSNAAYYGALRSLAFLERSVAHDEAAAGRRDQQAATLQAALVDQMWDPDAGAMLLNLDNPRRNHTQDANAGALLFGLLDQDQARASIRFLDTTLATPFGTSTSELVGDPYMDSYISPYMLTVEALGRFRYDDGQGALRLVRQAWGHMLRTGPGTPWEEMGTDGGTIRNANGLAHAWSTAVPVLSGQVLGVAPVTPGYRTWSVRPHPVDVRWAQGDVPTPQGAIAVRFTRGEGNCDLALTVEAPANTSGEVAIPLSGRDRTIARDGQVIWRDGRPAPGLRAHRDGDTVVVPDHTGAHTYAWTGPHRRSAGSRC